MDYQTKTRKILRECGAFIDGGHFVYNNGRHGDFYINKDALYVYPKKLDDICTMMSDNAITVFGTDFDVVLAPAVAGIVLGQNMAYNFSYLCGKEIRFAYAEKNPFDSVYRTIRRGYGNVVKDSRVLLVDDIVLTGRTLASMAQTVLTSGGEIVGASAICDRGQVRTLKYTAQPEKEENNVACFEVQIAPLVELDLQTFEAEACPFCKAKRPLDTEIGCGTIKDIQKLTERIAERSENVK